MSDKRDAAIQVKHDLSRASRELADALAHASVTGDKSLIDKCMSLHQQTFQLKKDLAAKLDAKSG